MEKVKPGGHQGKKTPMNFPVEKVKSIEVRTDDVFLISFHKSGTHWLKKVVQLIFNGGDNDIRGTPASESPFLEMLLAGEGDDPRVQQMKMGYGVPLDFDVKDMESPRLLCTHVNYDLLPPQLHEKKAKVIYLARNPKDVAASAFNHFSRPPISLFEDFQSYLEIFLDEKGKGIFSQWGPHVLEWWHRRHENNVLYVKYEDMKKDPTVGVRTIAEFIGKDLSPEIIDKIANYCSIEKMKVDAMDDPTVKVFGWKDNPFIRKGQVGGWKETFTVAQSELLDKRYKEWLKGSGLEFQFE
ncbi:sulfotransferase 1C4-like [Ptychodera flava]|uniref:sulfotransferase 1C4-like n=1 Tax=Ptychodera flava TaxID=63121 RepID=UPI003969DA78